MTLPNTDLTPSPFGFGTAYLGRRRLREGVRLLGAAFDEGITHIDTAPMYGLGLAERIVGRFLVGRRDAVTVTSKVGLSAPPRVAWALPGRLIRGPLASKRAFDVAAVRASLERSLRALGTDYVDLLLLHECRLAEVTDDLRELLAECVAKGIARATGTAASVRTTAAITQRWAPFPQVVEIPLDPQTAMDLKTLPGSDVRGTITHSTVSLMLQYARREMQARPQRIGAWSEALGVDCTQMGVWAGLALALARRVNPHGVALFSSRRPERVRLDLRFALRFGTEPQLLERASQLLREGARMPVAPPA